MKNQKTIIFVAKFIPFPAKNGGALRNEAWLNFFSKRYKVYLIGFKSKTGDLSSSNVPEENIFSFPFKMNLLKRLLLLVKWIFIYQPLIISKYYDRRVNQLFQKILHENNVEFVFCSELSSMQYASQCRKMNTAVLFDDHNVESELVDRMSRWYSFPKNYLLRKEAKRVRSFERTSLKVAAKVFCTSPNDKEKLQRLFHREIISLPNTFPDQGGMQIDFLNNRPTIVYTGNLVWRPNVHGFCHFLANIFPLIQNRIPAVTLKVVASELSQNVSQLAQGLPVEFFVNATEEEKVRVLASSWVGIAPLYFGSGTRIKIIEYWSHGLPVVSTDIGAEGLHRAPGTFIAENDQDFIKHLVFLLENKVNLHDVGAMNYGIYKKHYLPEKIFSDLQLSSS